MDAQCKFENWKSSRKYVENLPEVIDDRSITEHGFVFYSPSGEVCGFIEEFGPGFYYLVVGNCDWTEHGEDGLRKLEQKLWDNHVQFELQHIQ